MNVLDDQIHYISSELNRGIRHKDIISALKQIDDVKYNDINESSFNAWKCRRGDKLNLKPIRTVVPSDIKRLKRSSSQVNNVNDELPIRAKVVPSSDGLQLHMDILANDILYYWENELIGECYTAIDLFNKTHATLHKYPFISSSGGDESISEQLKQEIALMNQMKGIKGVKELDES